MTRHDQNMAASDPLGATPPRRVERGLEGLEVGIRDNVKCGPSMTGLQRRTLAAGLHSGHLFSINYLPLPLI
jgi:hypothetical protein